MVRSLPIPSRGACLAGHRDRSASPYLSTPSRETPKPLVGGSIPSGPASPHQSRGFAFSPAAKPDQKAPAHPLLEVVEGFLLSKRVDGCTDATLRVYALWLHRLLAEAPEVTAIAVRSFFVRLHERGLSPSRRHQAYRTLKTFCRWCCGNGRACGESTARLRHADPEDVA